MGLSVATAMLGHVTARQRARSSSSSLVQNPIEARTHGRFGRCRTITPCSASRRDSAAASALSHVTSVAWPGARDELDVRRDQLPGRARPAPARGRSGLRRPRRGSASDASAPSSCARSSQPQSKRAAPAFGVKRAGGVVAVLRVVGRRGHAQPLDPLGCDHEPARAAGPEQPLLPREGVERRARPGCGDRDRADRLRAVCEHRHAEPRELGRAAGRCRSSRRRARRRSASSPGVTSARDRVERLLGRPAAQPRDPDGRARGGERPEEPEMLDVGRDDLVARGRGRGRRRRSRSPRSSSG